MILEGGVAVQSKTDWMSVMRGRPPHHDVVQYPSPAHLLHILREKYSVRKIGGSVSQPGDPIPRFVYHCFKLQKIILCLSGPSNIGKSTVNHALGDKGVAAIEIDFIILEILKKNDGFSKKLLAVYKQGRIDLCYEEIKKTNMQPEIVDVIIKKITEKYASEKIIVLEGAILENKEFAEELTARCKEQKIVVGMANRQA